MKEAINNINDSDISISICTNRLLHEESSCFIENFKKIDMREIEPTTRNINENVCEEDFGIVIDELINVYSKMANNGKEEPVRKKCILDYMNNHKINSQEIYNWLLNNQNDSNCVYFLGYFNYSGIGISIDKQKALELYQKATGLKNNVARYNLAKMYLIGDGVEKNHVKAFKLAKILAKDEYLAGVNMLGYCYNCGIELKKQKAFSKLKKRWGEGLQQNSIGKAKKGSKLPEEELLSVSHLILLMRYPKGPNKGKIYLLSDLELRFAQDLENDRNNGMINDFGLRELLLHNHDFLEEFEQFCSCNDPKLYRFPNLYDFVKSHIYFIVIYQQQVEGLFNKLDLKSHSSMSPSVKQSKLRLSSDKITTKI
ncbi:kinase-like domain-containing protein [Rhizophagus clarus]|uniref:Kinase-like domain-containing protein n=1 Tax=Rhizophagus clarus TaxID=94130 RepID=A0A8H3QSZ2_9GLOM|nr:kinase-like domain-containing protein [Rhizophagus clarus]